MFEEQPVTTITIADLVREAQQMRDWGFRLVHIVCTAIDSYEITYVFEKDRKLQSLRITMPVDNPVVPSITGAYLAAFGYENELHDLFGVNVTGIAIDFKGNFYRTAKKAAFAPSKPATQAAQ
jgi:ech hydrogenase subunit D